jgi:hypothetical protein
MASNATASSVGHIGDVRRRGFIVPFALAAGLLSGCATMANGRHQNVLVISEPPGAEVLLNGEPVGTTPTTVRMRRRGPANLELLKPGCTFVATVAVDGSVSPWVAGNLIVLNPLAAQGMNSVAQWMLSAIVWFGGAITLDVLSGAAYRRPQTVKVRLVPLDGSSASAQHCQGPHSRLSPNQGLPPKPIS